ncbi:MAG: Eco57I restriction-modification methylase domain-containing protein, partial [Thermodesulfobacteriota bacterium]
ASFFDPEWMFGVREGFDAVIGNPPYVRIQTLQADEVAYLKEHYAAAEKGNFDLYVVFVERGLQLLQPRGQLAFILPHKFFNAQYGESLRGLLAKGKHLAEVVHFGDAQVFAGATTYTCLLFLEKAGADACRFTKVDDLDAWQKTDQGTEGAIPAANITAAEWNFTVGRGADLFEKLRRMPLKLGDVADIFVGLQTSADDVFIMNIVEENENAIKLHSKALGEDWTFEKSLLFPLVSGTDVQRYRELPERQYILFPYEVSGTTVGLIEFGRIAERYPQTASYLTANRKRLESREKGKFKDGQWHRFGRNQNIGIQNRVKLCVPRLVNRLYAAYDAEGRHYLDNVDV